MPRFTYNPKPKSVIGLGCKKTEAKSAVRPRLRRPEAKKDAQNFKNAILVLTFRPRVLGTRGQKRLYASVLN